MANFEKGKGGRPKLENIKKKTKLLGIRMTEDEMNKFEELCNKSDKKPGPLIRGIIQTLLQYYPPKELRELDVLDIVNPIGTYTVEYRIDEKNIRVGLVGITDEGKEFFIQEYDLSTLKDEIKTLNEVLDEMLKIKNKRRISKKIKIS